MKCTLISYTGMSNPDKYNAARLLVFTKNTRLKMTPDTVEEIFHRWPESKIDEELTYMANTIRSSWEFVDYVFLLTGLTRACTHQLVRHRTASFAQQTQQVLQIDPGMVETPRGLNEDQLDIWDKAVMEMAAGYERMIDKGAKVEAARGLLPQHIHTNIVVKMNLRTLVDFIHQRISPRNAGETYEVAKAMRAEVLIVHPWSEVFLNSTRDKAMEELDKEIQEFRVEPGGRRSGDFENSSAARNEKVNKMLKLVDQLRRG